MTTVQYNVQLVLLMKCMDTFDITHSFLAWLLLLPILSPYSHFLRHPTATVLSEIEIPNPFQIFRKPKTEMHVSHQTCHSPAPPTVPKFKISHFGRDIGKKP